MSFLRRIIQGQNAAERIARVPDGERIYVVGDIHGRSDLLEQMHQLILDDRAAGSRGLRASVVYLGDYVDRGLNSRQVLDTLIDKPLPGFRSYHLKGNHEDYFLRFMNRDAVGPSWFAVGGDSTVMSYGVRVPKAVGARQKYDHVVAEMIERVPPKHLKFLEQLELMRIFGDYACVHAGVRPGVPLDKQSANDLLWIRDTFLDSTEDHGKVIVHGHSPMEEPEVRRSRIGIDTAAFATNVLTCLVLEESERRFLATGGGVTTA